jgi:hypothetical protein
MRGRAMAEPVSHRLVNAEARVRSQVQFTWDFLWTKWHWQRFLLLALRLFAVNIIPPMLHTEYNHRLCYVT